MSTILKSNEIYRFYHSADEETMALKGVSMEIMTGEIVAVMGPSGSGKSTLISCLAGLDEPDGGFVEIGGTRITRRSEAERAAIRSREIGILQQSGNLFHHLTVEENMKFQMRLSGKYYKDRISLLLGMVNLKHRRTAYPSELSGGETARAGLAVALSNNPRIVVADEPTGELDAESEKNIIRLLQMRRNQGTTILLSTHSETLAKYADRVIRLFDGRVVDGA